MPRITAAASAFPPNVVPQTAVREAIDQIFAGRIPDLERMLAVFDHSRIVTRHLMRPLDWYCQPQSAQARNRIYLDEGLELLAQATQCCLERASCEPASIDHVIAVSSTGHAAPSMDARLINRLGLRRDVTRLPVWGLGCAAGAAGLARAFDHCRAHPRATALLVALETCSLTFMANDLSKKNLVGTAIFADGAAAVLVAGAEAAGSGPRLLATRSHLFPQSENIMGWEFGDTGMQLILSPRLPAVVKEELPRLVDGFLRSRGLDRSDLAYYLTHPGGAKVVDAYREALGLRNGELDLTEEVLREHGNVSSVSVLVVLEKWLASPRAKQAGYGLLSAFGPGFSAEQVLLEV
jgi:alkylresorcinol/alkylpyrone synthase